MAGMSKYPGKRATSDDVTHQAELESLLGKAVSKQNDKTAEPELAEDFLDCDRAVFDNMSQASEVEKSRQDIMLACLEAAKNLTGQAEITEVPCQNRGLSAKSVEKQAVLKVGKEQ